MAEYFAKETSRIESKALDGLNSKADWETWKKTKRSELFSMLGLAPDRERTELKPTITEAHQNPGLS